MGQKRLHQGLMARIQRYVSWAVSKMAIKWYGCLTAWFIRWQPIEAWYFLKGCPVTRTFWTAKRLKFCYGCLEARIQRLYLRGWNKIRFWHKPRVKSVFTRWRERWKTVAVNMIYCTVFTKKRFPKPLLEPVFTISVCTLFTKKNLMMWLARVRWNCQCQTHPPPPR